MRAGNLKHKIEIESYVEGTNTIGEPEKGWSRYALVYANVLPLSGREYFASKETNAEVTHKIELRYLSGVKPNMRVSYDGRLFDITSVINIREENKMLQLMVTETI